MPEEIFKHVKAVFTCKDCKMKFTKRLLIEGLNNIAIPEITPRVLAFTPTTCKKCGYNSYDVSYSFYHEEKIN